MTNIEDDFDDLLDPDIDAADGELFVGPVITRDISPQDIGAPFAVLDHCAIKTVLNRVMNQHALYEKELPDTAQRERILEELDVGFSELQDLVDRVSDQNRLSSSPWTQVKDSKTVLSAELAELTSFKALAAEKLLSPELAKSDLLELCWSGLQRFFAFQRSLNPESLAPLITYEPLEHGATIAGIPPLLSSAAPRTDGYGHIFNVPLESDRNEKRRQQIETDEATRFKAELGVAALGTGLEQMAAQHGLIQIQAVAKPVTVESIATTISDISRQLTDTLELPGPYCKSLLDRLPRIGGHQLEPGTVLFVKELGILKSAAGMQCLELCEILRDSVEPLQSALKTGDTDAIRDALSSLQRSQLALSGLIKLADPFYPGTLRVKGTPDYGEPGSDGLPLHRTDNLMTFMCATGDVPLSPIIRDLEIEVLTERPLRALLGLSDEFTSLYRDFGEVRIFRHTGAVTEGGLVNIDHAVLEPSTKSAIEELATRTRQAMESRSTTTLRQIDPETMPARRGALFFTVEDRENRLLGFSQIVVDPDSFLTKADFNQIPKELLPPGKPAEGTIIVLDPKVRELAGKHTVYQALNEIHAKEAKRAGCDYIIIRVDVSRGNPTPQKSAEGEGFKRLGLSFVSRVNGSDGQVREIPFEWYALELK